jgi:MoxR-like ATPase
MIARRVVQAFKADGNEGIKYFETLLNAYTTPDEVFGNVSLKGLNGELPDCKDKEVYRRLTEGMLPEADIAFLDEIWKANSTILNSLLTIVNERKYHNGNKVENVPLKALFAASNELPAKGQGLEALYDRLVLRLIVSFIEDEDKFFDMVESPSSSEFELSEDIKKLQITNAELKEWKSEIDKVSLSEAAKFVIFAVRKEFAVRNESMSEDDKRNGELFEVGDRRWKKIVHILKTSAFLNDRAEVDLMDCQLIEYCIWNTEKQQKVAREIVEKCIQQNGLDCDTAIDEIKEQIEEFDAYITDNFYIDNPDFKKIVKETIDGEEYYKIDYDDNTKRCWISETTLLNSDKKTKITDINSLDVDEDSLEINCSFYEKGRYVRKKFNGYYWCSEKIKDPKVFDTPDLLELRRTKAENEKYKIVANKIETEIEKLDIFAKEQTAPYRANLFADQRYCDVIMSTVTEAKRDLQNAQVDLDKRRSRYQE